MLPSLPDVPTRDHIDRLAGLMLQVEADGGGVDIETRHDMAEGLYARTITILPGTLLVGAAHKAEHLAICHGDITVWTETGMRRVTGFHVLRGMPGCKRVGLAHKLTRWTTVHLRPAGVEDPAEIEILLVDDPHLLRDRRIARAAAELLNAEAVAA